MKANNKNINEITFGNKPQPPGENKSRGIMEKRPQINLVLKLRDLVGKSNILPQLIKNIEAEVEEGINKNAIDLLKIIKEDADRIIMQNNIQNVQKVYITKEQDEAADEYIEGIINE